MLFNEPKLLKFKIDDVELSRPSGGFSALQRAEIAEISKARSWGFGETSCFSALQRAEIAEMVYYNETPEKNDQVSVLFNEPKLLKSNFNIDDGKTTEEFQCSSTSRNC